MRLGKLIADYRHRRSIQVQALAVEIGISDDILRRLEKGEVIKGDSLAKAIAWALSDAPAVAVAAAGQERLQLEGPRT